MPQPATSLADAFRHKTFTALWIATIVSNIGGWMYDASAAWLMTDLTRNPVIVALVQVAANLPLMLFALPAGAIADIVDKRRLVITLEISVTVFSAIFASLVSLHVVTAILLLLFMFALGALSALEAPAWQAMVPLLVPKKDLPSAISANSVGVNISRAIGPALAGAIIIAIGIAAPFWIDAFSNLGVILVLLWWRSPKRESRTLPDEQFYSAMRAGLRYARNNWYLRATLARAIGFFLFASAYWALLPLVARDQIADSAGIYGLLLGAIGAGAVGFAFVLGWMKARFGSNGLLMLGEAGTALALALFALAHGTLVAVIASLIAGASWIASLTCLNVSAQVSLPDWVRGRGLALYVMVFFGAMTVGSWLWGIIAGSYSVSVALYVAAGAALLAIPATMRWRLQSGNELDLSPSMHWPEPVIATSISGDSGPVMVTIEYRVPKANEEKFLKAMYEIARERKRDGAFGWGIFHDTADAEKFVEAFFLVSWIEHLRQHQRVTKADEIVQERVHKLISGQPVTTHLVMARPADVYSRGSSS
jgi:MFS family permease